MLKVCKYRKRQNWPNSNKNSTNTLRQEVMCSIYQDLMPASCLQNHFNAIQTPNTFVNRNFVSCNLRIFTRIFSAKIGRKIRPCSLGRKRNYILFKKECISRNAPSRSQAISYTARSREVPYRIQVSFNNFINLMNP